MTRMVTSHCTVNIWSPSRTRWQRSLGSGVDRSVGRSVHGTVRVREQCSAQVQVRAQCTLLCCSPRLWTNQRFRIRTRDLIGCAMVAIGLRASLNPVRTSSSIHRICLNCRTLIFRANRESFLPRLCFHSRRTTHRRMKGTSKPC